MNYAYQILQGLHGATQVAYEWLPTFKPGFDITSEIPRQAGQVVLVTGANTGLGERSAFYLAKNGATVVMACRSKEKGEKAAARIRANGFAGPVHVAELDLQRFESVIQFAQWFNSKYERLDIL
ncbi:hypothetical protein HDU93_004576, partial [Gonapodya sp. JEL0774]